jgi:hypothetical protein
MLPAVKIFLVVLTAAILGLSGFPLLLVVLLAASSQPVGGNDGEGRGIPRGALTAYAGASARVGGVVPGCVVPGRVLMAVGKVESDHAAGRSIDPEGEVDPPIVGPALDGSLPGSAQVPDTDGGSLDGDPAWDHAVGPMQILPSTWRAWGQDGNGDGVADPENYADAALTAAVVLCHPAADLSDRAELASALYRYNDSDAYVASVLTWADTYAGQTRSPWTLVPEDSVEKTRSRLGSRGLAPERLAERETGWLPHSGSSWSGLPLFFASKGTLDARLDAKKREPAPSAILEGSQQACVRTRRPTSRPRPRARSPSRSRA